MEMKAEALHLGRGADSGVHGPPGKCLCACAPQGSSHPGAQLTPAKSLPRARPPPDDPREGGTTLPILWGRTQRCQVTPPGLGGARSSPLATLSRGGGGGEGGMDHKPVEEAT